MLGQDGAADGETGAQQHLKLLVLGQPVNVGGEGDDWLSQKICEQSWKLPESLLRI